ncbi:MAG: LysR family transcriptional regulator [Magnetospiraceae bacterium]
MIKLQNLDLNLLVTFNLMYRERKTVAVAEALGVSQPAVSNAITRLRRHLRDELFERTAKGMRPTPFADSIAPSIAYALSTLQSGLNIDSAFVPARSERVFSLAMTDLGEMYILPKLMRYLAGHAPQVQISTAVDGLLPLKDQMEAGTVDMAVGLLPQLEAGFYQRKLFDQPYVCLMRKGHPLAQGPLTIERFSQALHLVIEAQGTWHGQVEKRLTRSGITRIQRLRLPNFMSAPYIVRETDLVATVTEKLALQTREILDLEMRAHPVAIPPAPINLFWHRRYHKDPGNIWLRNILVGLLSE